MGLTELGRVSHARLTAWPVGAGGGGGGGFLVYMVTHIKDDGGEKNMKKKKVVSKTRRPRSKYNIIEFGFSAAISARA